MNMRDVWYAFWSAHRGSSRGAYGRHFPKVLQEAIRRAETQDVMSARTPGRILARLRSKRHGVKDLAHRVLNCRCVVKPIVLSEEFKERLLNVTPEAEKAVWFGVNDPRPRHFASLVGLVPPDTSITPPPITPEQKAAWERIRVEGNLSVGYRVQDGEVRGLSKELTWDMSPFDTSDYTVQTEWTGSELNKKFVIDPKRSKE